MSRFSVLLLEIESTIAQSGTVTTLFSAQSVSNGVPLTVSQNPAATSRVLLNIISGSDVVGTLTLTGTDYSNAVLTEDIVITATGYYFSTKFFKTLTQVSTADTTITSFSGFSDGYINSQYFLKDEDDMDQIKPVPGVILGGRTIYIIAGDETKPLSPFGIKYNEYPVQIKIKFSETDPEDAIRVKQTISQDIKDKLNRDNMTTLFPLSVTNGLYDFLMTGKPTFKVDSKTTSRWVMTFDYMFKYAF